MAASKAYVLFEMEGRPWAESVTLWIDTDGEPRHVVPALVAAREKAKAEGLSEGLGRPSRMAVYMASINPNSYYFHSRSVTRPTGSEDKVAALRALIGYPDGEVKAPLGLAADYIYRVTCVYQDQSSDKLATMDCEVLQTTQAYIDKPTVENMKSVHPRQPVEELAAYVKRLANVAEIGGTPEEPF